MKNLYYFLKKNSEMEDLNSLLSIRLRKRIRIFVLSVHFAILIILILWYAISKITEHKVQVIKVNLFQEPVPVKDVGRVKKESVSPKASSRKAHSIAVKKKKKAIKEKKNIKKKIVKKKLSKPVKKKSNPKKIHKPSKAKRVKKKKRIVKRSTGLISKENVVKKPKKRYLKPEDIKISGKLVHSEPERKFKKIDIPSVSEDELKNKFLNSIKKSKVSHRITSSQRGGNISATYFNRISEYIYKIWKQPSKSETGHRSQIVEIEVRVDSSGRVLESKILRKSSNSAMNRSVSSLLRTMKSLPAPPNGKTSFSIELEVK